MTSWALIWLESLCTAHKIGIGMIFGQIKIRGVSLGAAAVLFAAIAFSAFSKSSGIDIAITSKIGHLGLALFAFAIGNKSSCSA
ncbi:aspartate-alanine antiporter-like transporter [Arcanobacterium haemolyticum]|uniref:aspartate-alanine antiporter-like transporter n=1 Tax=Arcanobacterium haemolyticum TaxID=28264 RepID=UPI0021ABFCB4|nr:hypothetical protein [Arcanobacterium haemolyticum]